MTYSRGRFIVEMPPLAPLVVTGLSVTYPGRSVLSGIDLVAQVTQRIDTLVQALPPLLARGGFDLLHAQDSLSGNALALLREAGYVLPPWLRTVHHHRGTLSAAPNFAYGLCATKLDDTAVADLDLSNVTVFRGRADALHGQQTFDVVTSRAVAPLDRLLEWSMPLVAPHGAVVAMKGSSAAEEVAAARAVLDRLGCADPTVESLGLPTGADEPSPSSLTVEPIRVVRVTWADPARVSLPSRSASGPRGSGTSRGRSKRRKS